MKAKELRKKYIEFFKRHGHEEIPSASLIPENDPTVLFTTAGMHPLVPYLMGENHPCGKRLTSIQKCVRTADIEEVGNPTHHTFFEMLGNWSLGDYFKKETIEMSFEFLTKILEIPIERLAVSVFEGDSNAPRDNESAEIWTGLGIPDARVAYLSKKDNWWGPAGKTGPCGPDTEMFYWTDGNAAAPEKFDPEDPRWVEIWNDVFMQYNKTPDGGYEPLKQRNVDTGMGLERTLACLNGLDDNYRTELFWPIIKKIESISGKKYANDTEAMRVIADHLRSAAFILGDEKGVCPSNVDQGYVLRRLIRRAIMKGRSIGIQTAFASDIANVVIEMFQDTYNELADNADCILSELEKEEEKFQMTIEKGMKEFEDMGFDKNISGKEAFVLFSTYGFPVELIQELASKRNITLDYESFQKELEKHQELSRTASAGKFKGGLADASLETKKGHTSTHLLLAALRKVLGDHVYQKGSNITPERIRFDFSHDKKMTDEEIRRVEEIVNAQIQKNLPVEKSEVSLEEAKKMNAMGVFGHKYQDVVKVYTIGDFSCEICGGPHVNRTGELGKFKILKEKASSAGVRRIRAIVE